MANTAYKWLALALIGGMVLSPVALAADDDTPPSAVENLEATPGDEEASFTWDPATDDTGVDGYYLYYGLDSVPEDADDYIGYEDAGDSTEYTITSLTNGMSYYFAVVAYDEAGNTSEEYSNEVEVTPEEAETGDFTAPTVQSADAMTSTLVEVEFSEAVVLPDDAADAFSIVGTDGEALEVLDATMSDEDSVVFVVTEDQTAGASYVLTVGITLEDEAGNPVVSGTSDTAIFTGSSIEGSADDLAKEDDEEETDEEEDEDTLFDLLDVEAEALNELTLEFTEDASDLGPDDFVIEWSEDASEVVEVLAVSVDDDDDAVLNLLTEDMEAGEEYVLSLEDYGISYEFEAPTLDLADLIAPEDVTDFLASIAGEDSVVLSWTASENSAGDLAKYIVYMSLDGEDYEDSEDVDADEVEYEWDDLTPGETYTFKITAVDESGNESEGEVSTVTLPEAGPGMLGMAGLALFGAGIVTRRRRDI